MSILQWNLRSFNKQRNDLRYLLKHFNPLVVCLQETQLKALPTPIPDYHFISFPHSLSTTCILIHKSVPFEPVTINTPLQCTATRIFLGHWFTIVSLYLSPSIPIDFTLFKDLLSQISSNFLLLGDFNCRHTLWGDSIINTRGRLLENFISAHDLFLLNSGTHTHFDARTKSFSCIDLSLCSPSIAVNFKWSVTEDTNFSDHFPILIRFIPYTYPTRTPRWSFNRADWTTFTSLTIPTLPPSTFSNSHDLLTFFLTTVLGAAYATIPRTSHPPGSKCVPWWNANCARALRIKRARWKSYRRKQNTIDAQHSFMLYKQASAAMRRTNSQNQQVGSHMHLL